MSGHIRRRGERSWELKYDVGTDASGARITRYHSVKGTKAEAKAKLVELLNDANKGLDIAPSSLTVAQFLDRWEQEYAAQVTVKTMERYRELLKLHVKPHIGDTKIQKLTDADLIALYAKLHRPADADGSALSALTVQHIHRVLRRALVRALKTRVIATNPAAAISRKDGDLPRLKKAEAEWLEESEASNLLARIRGRALYPLASLALASGMRRGELLALRWGRVNFDAGTIYVMESLEQTKKGLRFKEPKSAAGMRTISLPVWAIADLRAHWTAQQEMRLKLGQGKGTGEELVFGKWDGSPRSPNATGKEFGRTLAQLGLPAIGLHTLRHTHASTLLARGLDIKAVSKRLGHSDPVITLRTYIHAMKGTDDAAAETMQRAFGGAATD